MTKYLLYLPENKIINCCGFLVEDTIQALCSPVDKYPITKGMILLLNHMSPKLKYIKINEEEFEIIEK